MRKRVLPLAFILLLGFALVLAGCGGGAAPQASGPSAGGPPASEPPAGETPAGGAPAGDERSLAAWDWTQDHISVVPPMMFKDPFLELLGQTNKPIPYLYSEVVKLAGHSCGATAGAWNMTEKAMKALYPEGLPVRGQIKITAPGPADEWFVGVFGEIFTYLTGAAPESGFPGAEFGEDYNRRYLLTYKDEASGTPPPQMEWIFERTDTGKKVGVKFDVMKVMPPATPDRQEMSGKLVRGEATPEEAADWIKYWNDRAINVFDNADTLITVTPVE